MSLVIRRASADDAEVVALLARITFRETFGYLFERHEDDLRTYLDHTFAVGKIRGSLGLERNRYWLALQDELPMGYAKLKFPSPTELVKGPDVAQLQKIYVLREFVGQGIGKPLMDKVLADTWVRGAGAVWLDVLKENERARRFYERQGFAGIGSDSFTIGAQTFDFHLMVLRN